MTNNSTRRLFGTDGVRGEAGRFPLDAATIEALGSSLAIRLAARLGRPPVIIIGRDTRESGTWLENALVDGATGGGAICKSAGVITTPGVAFLARSLDADAGVVISASHNPYYDNGVKIFSPSGRKLDDETERLIERDMLSLANPSTTARTENRSSGEEHSLQERYLDFLGQEIGLELFLSNQTVVLDTANGAASKLAPLLFERLGANVIAINNKPDGRNINLNCGSMHIELLQESVVAAGAALGVAFDGDADRSLFVDAHGHFVDGDATLWVLAKYLSARNELNNDLVVATVMSNIGLEIALSTRGLKLIRTDVGDKYVLEELLRSDASLGGEQSGHIIFPRISLAGDGMITALCLLRAMVEEDKSLDILVEGFERYPQTLVNVRVREKQPFAEIDEVQGLADETAAKLGTNGRLLLRYSGTESLARIMIEGQDQVEIDIFARTIADAIHKAIGLT